MDQTGEKIENAGILRRKVRHILRRRLSSNFPSLRGNGETRVRKGPLSYNFNMHVAHIAVRSPGSCDDSTSIRTLSSQTEVNSVQVFSTLGLKLSLTDQHALSPSFSVNYRASTLLILLKLRAALITTCIVLFANLLKVFQLYRVFFLISKI